MDEQYGLLNQAMSQAPMSTAPIDVSVSRQYGDNTVTLRTQVGTVAAAGMPAPPPAAPLSAANLAERSSAGMAPPSGGIGRTQTRNSFYDDQDEDKMALLAEIERLKRKGLSLGITLSSSTEEVPVEDVAALRQLFQIADDTGDGSITQDQLGQLHHVLGEPLTDNELKMAFKAMDTNKAGYISFDEFLTWFTMAHSKAGFLSKKGDAYTKRFAKMMASISGSFDLKHLTTASTGEPGSLDYRVQFHYNDAGQLKQISPWHDIPLYSPDGYVHMVTEIPKFSRAKFEIATGEPFNPIKQDTKNGKLREYKYGDMCFNYGAFPQTWEDPKHKSQDTGYIGDNDPIDAMEIGYKILRTGSVTKVKILGCLAMIDDGETDWKVICIAIDDPLAPQLNDITDVERLLPGYIATMREWLRMYKTVDGKPKNAFALEEKAMNRDYTLKIINETNGFWQSLQQRTV